MMIVLLSSQAIDSDSSEDLVADVLAVQPSRIAVRTS